MPEQNYTVCISDTVLLATVLDDKIDWEFDKNSQRELAREVCWAPKQTNRRHSSVVLCTRKGLDLLLSELNYAPVMDAYAGCGGTQSARERQAIKQAVKRIEKIIDETKS